MAVTNSYVTIKGTKDGLVFQLSDECSYQEIIKELEDKLQQYDVHVFNGPLVNVSVELGKRYLTLEQEEELKEKIRSQGNLIVEYIGSDVVPKEKVEQARLEADVQVLHKTVRSGQVLQSDRHVLLLGDVNPGGSIRAKGNIYVMGALRGMAHAGIGGDQRMIISASLLDPTQLRIAGMVSRPPDEWPQTEYVREFAYISEDRIMVDKLRHLQQVRPDFQHIVHE